MQSIQIGPWVILQGSVFRRLFDIIFQNLAVSCKSMIFPGCGFKAVAPSLRFVFFSFLSLPLPICFLLSPLLTKMFPLLHPSSSTILFLSLYLLFFMFFRAGRTFAKEVIVSVGRWGYLETATLVTIVYLELELYKLPIVQLHPSIIC